MKTLFYGGKILTLAKPAYAEALLAENGKIVAVGREADLRTRAGACREVNLNGGTLMPGFIDPHSHFFQAATAMLQVSLDGADSPEEIGRRLAEYIRTNSPEPGRWIVARDYDNNCMPGLQNPTLEQLDSFAPQNPLVIHHKSGHMGLMNSPALAALGVTAETPSPEGGKIEKKDGRLTGYLEENGFINLLPKIPMAGMDQILAAVEQAQTMYASYGITTVQDGMVARQMLPLYDLIRQKKLLKLDVMLFLSPDAYDEGVRMFGREPNPEHIQAAGLKIFLDGSPQGRTAWMRRPYAGSDDYCGYGTLTDEAVESAMTLAAEKKTQLICHCNGDAAAEQFLRCLEKTEKTHPELQNLRPVIIHGQLMGRDQQPRAKKLGAMVSYFIAHIYHWGDVHLRNFGPDRANFISAAGSAKKNGLKFTFHQDTPVIRPDMLETLWCATCRTTKNGVLLGADERLSNEDALRAITENAAYQYFSEARWGTLEPGKQADLVLLDRDPLETPCDQLRRLKVEKTFKNGECIFSRS